MSNFNKIKDRDQHGKAKPHFRVPYPSYEAKYCHYADRYGRRSPGVNYNKNPGWWNNIFTTRKRRADDRANAVKILHGHDPDGIGWLCDKRPTDYYW